MLGRAFARHCPYCGGDDIFSSWLTLKPRCRTCGALFAREDGYFLGAYALNLLFAEFVGLGGAIYLLFWTSLRSLPLGWQMVVAGGLALVLPILFFPFSRTIWIAIDLLFDRSVDRRERPLHNRALTDPPARR